MAEILKKFCQIDIQSCGRKLSKNLPLSLRNSGRFISKILPQSLREDAARQSLGEEMWRGYRLPNGKLGCAAALSNVFKPAGITTVGRPLVTVLRKQLLSKGGQDKLVGVFSEIIVRNGEGGEISDAALRKDCKPGDILLAFSSSPRNLNGGTSAHCGIMGKCSSGSYIVYTNNYIDGIWTEIEIHQMFDCYPYLQLLRPRGK